MNRCEDCDKVLFEQRMPVTEVFCQAKGKRKLKSLAPRVQFSMKAPGWCPNPKGGGSDE